MIDWDNLKPGTKIRRIILDYNYKDKYTTVKIGDIKTFASIRDSIHINIQEVSGFGYSKEFWELVGTNPKTRRGNIPK